MPANTLIHISYSHTGPEGTDGPRIISLSVAEPEADNILLGDVNGDGMVDLGDIGPFVDLLFDPFAEFQAEADINGDMVIDLGDIGPFVALLFP